MDNYDKNAGSKSIYEPWNLIVNCATCKMALIVATGLNARELRSNATRRIDVLRRLGWDVVPALKCDTCKEQNKNQ